MNEQDEAYNRVIEQADAEEQQRKEEEELKIKQQQLEQQQAENPSGRQSNEIGGEDFTLNPLNPNFYPRDTRDPKDINPDEGELGRAVVGGAIDLYNSIGSLPKFLDKEFYEIDDPENPYKFEAPWLIEQKPIMKTQWGKFVRTGVEFGAGMIGTGKVIWGVKGLKGLATTARASRLGRIGLGAVQGATYDFISNQSQEQNLARTLIDVQPNWAGILNPIATNEDMSPAMRSAYNIGEGLGIGGLFDTAFEAMGWGLRSTSVAAKKVANKIVKDPIQKAIVKSADVDYGAKTVYIESKAKQAFERSMFRKLKNKGEVTGDIKAWRKTGPWEKLPEEQRRGLMQVYADKNELDWGPHRDMDLRSARQATANKELAKEHLELDLATGTPRQNPAYYKGGDITDNQALSSSTMPVKGPRDMIEIRNNPSQKYGSPRGTLTEANIRRLEYSAPGTVTAERDALAKVLEASPAYHRLYGEGMAPAIAEDLANATGDLIKFVNDSGHSRLIDVPQGDVIKYIKAKDAHKPTIIEGMGALNKSQLVATDTVLGQLLYESRDLAKAGLSVQDQIDVAADGGLLDGILARYAAIARMRKETSMLSSFNLRRHNAGGNLKDTIEEATIRGRASDAAAAEIRTFKQLVKNEVDDDLLESFMHFTATTNGDKQSWKDLNEFFHRKLHGYKSANKYQRNAILNELQTMGINSMLSGPKTPVRALVGTGLQTVMRPVATILGSLGRSDDNVTMGAFQSIGAMISARDEAWKKAVADFNSYGMKEDGWRGFIQNTKDREWDGMMSYYQQHGTLGEQASMHFADSLRRINKMPIFNYGPRTMRAIDTYFTQIIGRARQRQLAFDDVWSKIKAQEGQDFIIMSDDKLNAMIKKAEVDFESKVWSSDGQLTDEMAIFASDEAKLTQELTGWTKKMDMFFNELPFARPFFLFARTGVNAFRMTSKYTPYFNRFIKEHSDIMSKSWDDPDMIKYGIKSANDLEIAKATMRGRAAIGWGVTSSAAWMALNGQITGNGPPDRTLRNSWIQAGWQPRSIKVGDRYVSYEALEPFNIFLSSIADVVDAQKVMGDEWTSNWLGKYGFIVAQNVTNKSFMAGLLQLQDLMVSNFADTPRVLANFTNNQIPLAGLRNEIGKVFSPGMRELNSGFWQSIGNRNLWADVITTKNVLPYRYDILNGEKIRDYHPMTRMVNAILPFHLNIGTNETRELLMRSGINLKQTFNTGPDGEGLEHHTDLKSKYQFYMGQQNLEAQLTEMFENDPQMKASILKMERDRLGGREYDPNNTYHSGPIYELLSRAKKNAWDLLMADPELGGKAEQLVTLHEYNQLGNTLREQGRWQESEQIHKEVQQLQKMPK